MHRKTLITCAITVLTATGLAACGGGGDDSPSTGPTPGPAPVSASAGDTVALTASSKLISFDRASPGTQVSSVGVTGLTAGDSLLGIDYRPADGKLYALGSGGRIYTLDPATGAATLKSTLIAAADDDNPFAALIGSNFGVDFNPVADRLRVVGDTGQNLRINVDTGATITDGTIASAAGPASITASAYTNAFAGASSTELYAIDASAGVLYDQDPPNAGTLVEPVSLGGSGATAVNGFDIDARDKTGYAAFTIGGATALYRIDIDATAAAATSLGPVASGESLVGLALKQSAAVR